MVKLTSGMIERAMPKERRFILWDDEVKGFGCRVLSTGRKSFVLQYRTHSGTSRTLTLGRHRVLTCKAARELARGHLADVGKGLDPALERREKRASATMSEFFHRYMNDHARPFKKPKSSLEDEKLFDRHIMPRLGGKKVSEVSASDITTLHASMSGTPVYANRSLSLLSKMFSLAERWGYRGPRTNPCHGLSEIRYRERQHNRRLAPDEIKCLWAALDDLGQYPAHQYAVAAIRLLMLTGARKGEILSSQWGWVDWERGRLLLPDSKTGQKTVHLNQPALEVMQELNRVGENPHIIIGRAKNTHMQDLRHIWAIVLKMTGICNLRIHDLRHVYATTALDNGTDIKVISELLGHKSVKTTERYLRTQERRSAAAAESVAQQLINMASVDVATNAPECVEGNAEGPDR